MEMQGHAPPTALTSQSRAHTDRTNTVLRAIRKILSTVYSSDFQPFSPHGTHKLITNILRHTKKYFCQPDKKIRYNFDSLTWDSYCVIFQKFDI